MWLSNKIVGLDLAPLSEMVATHRCRSKKNVNYHNILLSSQNDQTGSVAGLWNRSRRFLGGVGVGFLTTLGVGVGYFCPTPTVQLDHFLDYTSKLGIPVEMVQSFFETFVETRISCCVARFPLILTAQLHSLYVKESEILKRSESGVGNLESRSRIAFLRLRNSGL